MQGLHVARTILVLGRESNNATVSNYEDLRFGKIDSGTAGSIPVLRSRFRYCKVDLPVLRRPALSGNYDTPRKKEYGG